ncbi:MAG TPA: CPBP family intramembrane metalloprotease [Sedimentisphaerales bacterium]|nr:CPBP family intramembrane metalloprotease [Sedimentisphaerales bacterium]HRS10159.1 CPBP family intramembrane metalloprotease [Sedimentisphaerales bacterium]HRV46865.1 CPBP family intramembrane metalloprotease [Sedimentisphaerales bacterium]
MDPCCLQSGPAGSTSFEPAGLFPDAGTQRPVRLAVETLLVTVVVFVVLRLADAAPLAVLQWLLIPTILVAAALLPTWLARREFPRLGFEHPHLRRTLRTVGIACITVLPVVLAGVYMASRLGIALPLQPTVAGRTGWLAWLLYQLLYVAVAEELFFRGYVQANIMRLLARWQSGRRTLQQWIAIVASAVCFALAHLVVQGRAVALLTFLPGLLLAWLFVHTRSLLGPILFHGLANISYGIMACMLL